ncbi:MAG TPA: hypothetical protein VF021_12905 [Longimicrobiales bacterium]
MKTLGGFPLERTDRHATALLHDDSNVRIVAFTLAAGQEVAVHTSKSTVAVHVVGGSGAFIGDVEDLLSVGQSAVYEPGEPHGMRAGAEGLHFVAFITPSPSAHA